MSLASSSLSARAANIDAEKLAHDCRPAVMLVFGERVGTSRGTLGTGFVISADGRIVTNHHVIEGANRITARSSTGGTYKVTAILADDAQHDVAVLKMAATDMPTIALGDETSVHPGLPVVVIGNPTGLEGSITDGIVSAARDYPPYGDVFQISAAISHGSSGSPLLNSEGKVLGIATFHHDNGQSLNFAVSIRYLKALLKTIDSKPPVVANADGSFFSPSADTASSHEEDEKVLKDASFEKLKQLEVNHTFALMLECAKDLAKRFPKSALAQRRLSDAYYYSEFINEAVLACRAALELDPVNGRAWNNLAILCRRQNDTEAALVAYREGLKVAPADAKLWMEYGAELKATNTTAALDAVRTAVQLLKDGRGVDEETVAYPLYSQAADALRELGRMQEAYDSALLGVRACPKESAAWVVMARTALALKKYEHVRPYLQKAFDTGGAPDVLYQILGISEEEQGHVDAALDALKKAAQANERNPHALAQLIRFLVSYGQPDQSKWAQILTYMDRLQKIDAPMAKETETFITTSLKLHQLPR